MKNLKASLAIAVLTFVTLVVIVSSLEVSAGAHPFNGVALAADQGKPYVVTTVPLGTHPKGVAVNWSSGTIYVAMFDSSCIQTVSEATLARGTCAFTQGLHPNQLRLFGFDNLYVTNRDSNSLALLDAHSLNVLRWIPTGKQPWGLEVANDKVFVGNFGSSSISVFDIHLDNLLTTIPLPNDAPGLMTLGFGGVYVPGWQQGKLYVVNGRDNSLTSPASIGAGAFAVAEELHTRTIYMGNRLDKTLHMLHPDTYYEFNNVTLPGPPYGIAVNYKTDHVFVVDAANDRVYVLRSGDGSLLATLPVGHQDANEGGQGLAVNVENNRVYVSNYADGSLTVIQDEYESLYPTATETPNDVVMSGVVYDASVGLLQGIEDAVVQVGLDCYGWSTGTNADSSGHYSITVPGSQLHYCGKAAVQSFATGYSSVAQSITETDLRSQPHRDWGLNPLSSRTPMPTPTRTPTPTATETPTRTETFTPEETVPPISSPTPSSTPTATVPACSGRPDAPILISPENGASVSGPTVQLDWDASNCSTSYKVVIREGSQTGTLVVKQGHLTATEFTTGALEVGKTYVWKVQARNSAGRRGSAWWSFTVNASLH